MLNFCYALIISAISIIPFWLNYEGDFVFDDSEAIVKNKDISSDFWPDAFLHDFWGEDIQSNLSHKSYRPLSILSFRFNYFVSKKKLIAAHFKVTNIVCHSMCSLIVWRVLKKIFNESIKESFWRSKALLAALLFSVHPVHVECVSGIVGRADILAAILFFLAFWTYCKARKSRNRHMLLLLKTIALAGLSMLCKENGITVLGFCIVYEIVNKLTKRNSVDVNVVTSRVLILVLGAFTLLYVRWLIMGSSKPQFKPIDNPAAFEEHPFKKILTFQYIYFLNALLLIWPEWLCYDWSMGCVPLIEGIHDYRIPFVLMLYGYGYLALNMIESRRNLTTLRHIFLGLSLIFIPFLPAANIFYPVGFVVAERILYIPSAGFCILIIIGLCRIIERKTFRKAGQCFYFLLLIAFSLKSWQRSREWKDEYSLFLSGLSVCPLNAKVHYNVAKVADAKQQTDWALQEYKEAIRLYPKYYQAMNNVANLLKNKKEYDEAEWYLRRAISTKFDFPAAWMNLGIVLANTKRYVESENAYRIAIKYRKNYPDCFYNLGFLNLELNQTEKALENFFEAIRLNPKHNLAWTNVLALLDNSGESSHLLAIQLIPKALEVLSDSPSVNFAVANIYGKLEKYEDAEKHFLIAIKLFGEKAHPIHYSNLGVLYHRWKKFKQAQEMYEKALNIDPNFVSAVQNLKSVRKYVKIMSSN